MRFSRPKIFSYILFTVIYMSAMVLLVGLRQDHVIFYGVITTAYFATEVLHRFVLSFIFFLLFWIIYDSLRVVPNYEVNLIHIIEPYQIEKAWFGIKDGSSLLTPNEFLRERSNQFLDLISGLYYLMWVPLPLAYGVFLFFKDRELLIKFSLCFLFINILGFVVYYLYPAAPPWYYDIYGNSIDFSLPGNAAGLLRFDEIVGTPIFENMYTKNSNVFAAMPSLHAAYPIVLFYFSLKRNNKILSTFFFTVIIGIWFAAVYSFHHYIIDLLAGGLCAMIGIISFELILSSHAVNKSLQIFVKFIGATNLSKFNLNQ